MDGDRKIHINIDLPDSIANYYVMDSLPNWSVKDSFVLEEYKTSDFQSDVVLDEISVSAKKSKRHNKNGTMLIANVDWMKKSTDALSLIRNLYPSSPIIEDKTFLGEYRIYVRFPKRRYSELQLFVDDLYRPDIMLRNIVKEQIYSLDIKDSTVNIVLDPNFKTEEQKLMEMGIEHHELLETSITEYSHNEPILSENNSDTRRTIYWQAMQYIPAGEKIRFIMTTSDLIGSYTLTATAFHPVWGRVEQQYPLEIQKAP